MALRTIRDFGDDMLRKKAKEVSKITPNILALLDDMRDTLRDVDGVGLAAPQIGVLRRVIIVDYDDKFYEMINPKMVHEEGTQRRVEACLSVPGKKGTVDRPKKVVVEAMNRHGEMVTVTAEDAMATVFCHEIDHLDGVLFLDRAENVYNSTKEDAE